MYGLKKDIDFGFLIGREVTQVRVALYDVHLDFDGGVLIAIRSGGTFSCAAEGVLHGGSEFPNSACCLFVLLDKKIERYAIKEKGTLEIVFSGGAILTLYDSDPHYESYEIYGVGQNIIV